MRRTGFALAALLISSGMAVAADPLPLGEWLVADGVAHIKIENCAGRLWGVVSWEKEAGIDSYNPDPSKRSRPTFGMPVLLGMKATEPNRWDGEIYNAENGKTYTANISLASPDVLRVQGCVLGFLCGGQEWTRVKPETRGAGAQKRDARGMSAKEVCAKVADSTAASR